MANPPMCCVTWDHTLSPTFVISGHHSSTLLVSKYVALFMIASASGVHGVGTTICRLYSTEDVNDTSLPAQTRYITTVIISHLIMLLVVGDNKSCDVIRYQP